MISFYEQFGKFGEVRTYKIHQAKYNRQPTINRSSKNIPQLILIFFRQIFLPQGYPDSVSNDYLNYQLWDTLQAFCSTISGIFATQEILKSVGVGDESITALSATITWILKDGVGMVGKILFTWLKGHCLDNDSKKWRLFADFANDLAMFIEMLLPKFPHFLIIYILCFTTVLKSIVGVVGGATRTAIIQHQAIRGNLADVAAKDNSQETLVNLCASFCGLYLLTSCSKIVSYKWLIFAISTFLHIFANYKAVKSLQIPFLNSQRLLIIIKEYLKNKTIGDVKTVNNKEQVTLGFGLNEKSLCGVKINIGASFNTVIKAVEKSNKSTAVINQIVNKFNQLHNNEYILIQSEAIAETIFVLLKANTSSVTIIHAYIESVFSAVSQHCPKTFPPKSEITVPLSRDFLEEFSRCLSAHGWILTRNLLTVDEWRFTSVKLD